MAADMNEILPSKDVIIMGRKTYIPPNPNKKHTIMTKEERDSGKKTYWNEMVVNGSIKNLSPALFSYTHLRVLFLDHNQLQKIPPEISKLVNLEYLNLSNNRLVSIPAEIGDMAELKDLRLNDNQLRQLPYELGKLFQLQHFTLDNNPVLKTDVELSEVYITDSLMAVVYMLDRLRFSSTHPPQRPWQSLDHPERDKPTAIFTVMNYNVLCDSYCSRQAYGYTPSWALHWDYRRKGILDEIRHYSADIISLQEVEKEQFDNFFKSELKNEGYDGIFESKSRCKTMPEDSGKRVDGCAIFWRADKFELRDKTWIEYSRLAIEKGKTCPAMMNRVQNKDNIGLCALLYTKDGAWDANGVPHQNKMNRPILVANTHMTWDPDYCDVKLIQTMMLMDEIKSFLKSTNQLQSLDESWRLQTPMILCGDFNSSPDSGVLSFLTNGMVDKKHQEFQKLYDDHIKVLEAFSHSSNTRQFTHSFHLENAYPKDVMKYTNYTYEFKGILDYVFHTHQFKVLGVLGDMDQSWFEENKVVGCPHPHIPSDHFSLLVEFELCEDGS